MKLQFTNGYRPRFDHISRILQFLLTQGDKKISRQEIVSALGIPENQVENLTSMMTGFGLVRPRVTTLTPFGRAVIQSDPYFEKSKPFGFFTSSYPVIQNGSFGIASLTRCFHPRIIIR